jgi:uncharacterized OB-fold protein
LSLARTQAEGAARGCGDDEDDVQRQIWPARRHDDFREGPLVAAKPIPVPDPASEGFWAAAASRVLAIQRCTHCGWYAYPPNVVCRNCLAPEPSFRYEPVSGRGRVTTWTVVHQAFLPGFGADIPYVVAEVELAEQEGLRMIARLAGVRHGDLAVGMPVEVAFDDVADGIAVPRFVPAAGAA